MPDMYYIFCKLSWICWPTTKILYHHGWWQQHRQWHPQQQMPQYWFGRYSTGPCSPTCHGQEHNHWCRLCQEKLPFSPIFQSNQNSTALAQSPALSSTVNQWLWWTHQSCYHNLPRCCQHYQRKLQDALTQYDMSKV